MTDFYAQHGEDRWLADNWASLGLPDVGTFCEFGAADGLCSSNTLWLERARGWRGLLIEPDPRWTMIARPGSVVCRDRVVGPRGMAQFVLDPEPALSGTLRGGASRIALPQVPLSDLLDEHGFDRLDLVSIDTEGTEIEAWRTLDLSRFRPRVAIVEHFTLGIGEQAEAVIAALAADGYAPRHRTECNLIFVDQHAHQS